MKTNEEMPTVRWVKQVKVHKLDETGLNYRWVDACSVDAAEYAAQDEPKPGAIIPQTPGGMKRQDTTISSNTPKSLAEVAKDKADAVLAERARCEYARAGIPPQISGKEACSIIEAKHSSSKPPLDVAQEALDKALVGCGELMDMLNQKKPPIEGEHETKIMLAERARCVAVLAERVGNMERSITSAKAERLEFPNKQNILNYMNLIKINYQNAIKAIQDVGET